MAQDLKKPNGSSAVLNFPRAAEKQSLNPEREDRYFYDLSNTRAQEKDLRETERIERETEPPSGFKYFIGYLLSIIGDLLDIIAAITVVGVAVEWIIDIVIDLPLLWLGFNASKKMKNLRELVQNISPKIQATKASLAQVNQLINREDLTRSQKFKSLFRAPPRTVKKAGGKAAGVIDVGNPVGNILVALLIDMIPYIDVLPLRTYMIWKTHKAHKKAYQEFQLSIQEYMETKVEEIEAKLYYTELSKLEMLEEEEEAA